MTIRCSRSGCKGILRSASSVAAGISPACAAKERAEEKERALRSAVAPFSAKQVTDATALAGRLTPASRPGIWLAPSSDGVTVYRLSALWCPCKAQGPCRHQCAVIMRELAESWQEAA
jgi:hypothetical protein